MATVDQEKPKKSVATSSRASQKRTKNLQVSYKICKAFYQLSVLQNHPTILQASVKELILYVAKIDSGSKYSKRLNKLTKQIHKATGEQKRILEVQYRNILGDYYRKSLRTQFKRDSERLECIEKVATVVSGLNQLYIHKATLECKIFMESDVSDIWLQWGGWVPQISVAIGEENLQSGWVKLLGSLMRFSESGYTSDINEKNDPNSIYKWTKDLFKSKREIKTHGVHYEIRGGLYNREFDAGKSPSSVWVDEELYDWYSRDGGWYLDHEWIYGPTLDDRMHVYYQVKGGTISVQMGSVEETNEYGYCLNHDQHENYIKFILNLLSESLNQNFMVGSFDPIVWDINQDIPFEYFKVLFPEVVKTLEAMHPECYVKYEVKDPSSPIYGCNYKIYKKKYLVQGVVEEFLRFEFSVTNKFAGKEFKKLKKTQNVITHLLFEGVNGLLEGQQSLGGDLEESFDEESNKSILAFTSGFSKIETSVNQMGAKVKDGLRDVITTAIVQNKKMASLEGSNKIVLEESKDNISNANELMQMNMEQTALNLKQHEVSIESYANEITDGVSQLVQIYENKHEVTEQITNGNAKAINTLIQILNNQVTEIDNRITSTEILQAEFISAVEQLSKNDETNQEVNSRIAAIFEFLMKEPTNKPIWSRIGSTFISAAIGSLTTFIMLR